VASIIKLTTSSKPANATHWSTRSMAEKAGVSEATVRRIWCAHGLKPHLSRTFKVSNDPQFAEKFLPLLQKPPQRCIRQVWKSRCSRESRRQRRSLKAPRLRAAGA
jgi:hypothetical protein